MYPYKKILVVEDNPINRAMLKKLLSDYYVVLEAENGKEAFDILGEHKDVALILLDIMMPVMDGYAFLALLKDNPALSAIPVIVTTQSDREEDEVRALSEGATDFVSKPYRPQIILHRIGGILRLRENAAIIDVLQYDRLTGLYTKEFFFRRVSETLAENPDKQFNMICSNIENFKLINDVLGVSAGDALLREASALCLKQVEGRGICGRFEADRFMCLIEKKEYDEEFFLDLSCRLNARPLPKELVIKWGIYEIVDRDLSVSQMCNRAILAVGSIKGLYGKIVSVYDEVLRRKLLREQSITENMEAALSNGEFTVYFQPKYRIKDERLSGAEALVRWEHPEWGFLSPGEFIPLFEKNGFITRLDKYVWDRTCFWLRRWQDEGYPSVPVSVNVSRADVYQADLPDCLLKIVRKHGLTPACLHLEITESAFTEDTEQVVSVVAQLRKLGFVVEMDDFGSGYSSLNMISQMTLDILKLDMRFLWGDGETRREQGVLRFVVALARWMNLRLVAEGVETQEQLDMLREVGCDYAQGYFFAKPMKREDFEKLLSLAGIEEKPRGKISPDGGSGKPFLLAVDEDCGFLDMTESVFGDRYQVLKASDRKEALSLLSGSEYAFDAAIVSLTLPGGEGFALVEELSGKNASWQVPVLATGPKDGDMESRAVASGARDVVFKPCTAETLQRRLRFLLGDAAYAEKQRLLQEEARLDYLTGLLNRRGFYERISRLTPENLPAALYFFDLDDMKQINDRYGHDEGDRMLIEFGKILRRHTRRQDIVCRYGGDEFVVVVAGAYSETETAEKGEEICRAFREGLFPFSYGAACSVGAASYDGTVAVDAIVARADRALYLAKSESKGGCRLWKEDIET